ncbi:S8 family serine peptidase [Leptolyngbya sp. 7M]|uniref:S8 family serine peptidase n=1 Tax=Leptolyngbya sp. 7M TaxID=2812896 RepID=UPI001B8C23A6|nr:S8 family serine peptidase [Leptolyngbya sp. 7M]QYO66540.1 S8 family serine peptidase [Leptolyngbya sp. 7M]
MRPVSSRIGALAFFALAAFIAWIVSGSEQPLAQHRTEPQFKGAFARFASADSLTEAIRNKDFELVRVNFRSLEERDRHAKDLVFVQDFGNSAIVATKDRRKLEQGGADITRLETTVHLPGSSFDPVKTPPASSIAASVGSSDTEGYFVVQFGAATDDQLLNSLRDIGLEVIQYVPHQAFIVYGSFNSAGLAAEHSRVRWVGEYLPDHKMPAELKSFVDTVKDNVATFDIAYFSRADVGLVANEFRSSIRGRVISENRLPNNFFNVVRVEMPVSELESVIRLPHVFRIDPYIRPQIEDERAAQIVAGNYVNVTTLNPPGYDPLAQFGADGTGVTVMVSDDGISIPGNGGFYVTASNTIDGPLRGATAGAAGGHGHINASIIAGWTPFGILDPTGYNYGIGVAPRANIINIPFLKSGNTTTDAQAVDDALNTLGPNGVRGTISNNSWGSGTNGNSYDSFAATYDGLVRDGSFAASIDPFSIIFSAGNSGTSGLTRPKMSKNTIAVANSENIRTELGGTGADNMDDLRSTSSRGPAADGRIKPDITAPGTVITGSRAGTCGSVTSCFDANHAYSSGTSHAAPQVAGAAALFTQYWRDRNAGAMPRPSLIKAAIISTGQEMNGSITNTSTIPNGNEGWGRMNMKFMMNTGVPMKYVNETQEFFSPGQNVVYSGTVGDPSKPFRVTLVWTDPPGVSNPALVNNLDLSVQVGANLYRGNVFSNGHSATGGAFSTVDNVENVFLPAGIAAGTPITITVNATALNGDGILGNADATDQHFSLVAYNFAEAPETQSAPFDFTGDGRSDLSIYRSSLGEWWYSALAGGGGALQFGATTDVIVPGDNTGDGKTDFTLFRPSTGQWFVLRSEDYSYFSFPFGSAGDIPAAGDLNGDGRDDFALFRPSVGIWYIQFAAGGTQVTQFGQSGDLPAVGDYDGDGIADLAIYRPNGGAGGEWWISRSSAGVVAFPFGTATDRVIPGDFTGDGKTDAAIWRPSNGFWYILRSEDNSFYGFPFGSAGDIPVPGDYDGDGRFDPAIFRTSNSNWFIDRTTAGMLITQFGLAGDTPVPSAFVR